MSNIDPAGQRAAAWMGERFRGQPVDLDEGIPFDIYELFADVTGRDYNCRSEEDELTILEYASAFERSAGS